VTKIRVKVRPDVAEQEGTREKEKEKEEKDKGAPHGLEKDYDTVRRLFGEMNTEIRSAMRAP